MAKYSKSKYPIGATWECKNDAGRSGKIWFAEISDYGWEIWRWNAMYSDGSGLKFDWGTSYVVCKKSIPVYGRFKRIN